MRETYRLVVIELPETPLVFGPYLGYEPASQHGRYVLELQECCTRVPRISDIDVDFMERSPGLVESDTRFSGRLVEPLVSLQLVTKWVSVCDKLHEGLCNNPLVPSIDRDSIESQLVIDVERMCVTEAPRNCRYVALSYCWGQVPVLKHVLQNSESLQIPGSLLQLTIPETIAHAIELLQGIGERYLWVDALCIIQDDPVSRTVQLAQMGLIYASATFTIVAASGDNADCGLPGVGKNARVVDQKLVHLRDYGKTLLSVIDVPD